MNSFSDIQRFLIHRLGLSRLQVKIYTLLIQNGQSNITYLSKKTGYSRGKIFKEVINGLKFGIYLCTKRKGEWSITACEFDCLTKIASSKLDYAKQTLDMVEKTTTLLKKIFPCSELTTNSPITYYEGYTSVWIIYKQIFNSTEIFSFSDIDSYYSLFPQTAEYWDEAFERNPSRTIFEITPDTPLTRQIASHPLSHKYAYHTKLIPQAKFNYSQSDMIAFDDNLTLIDLSTENPKATVIHSPTIANNFKQIHKIAWKQTDL